MTLPSSGPLSLSDIQGEFGGSNPIGMNEYYAGGGLVPAGTTGTYGAVPSSGALSVQNFYGTSNYIPVYIEDVFSTYLYTGNATARSIVNGINLADNGGLVWIKSRTTTGYNHSLFTPNTGVGKWLTSNGADSLFTDPKSLTAFNNNGFSLGVDDDVGQVNYSGNYVSWTFRKQPKFFDIVTYTGNGVDGRVFTHNFGSTVGMVIVKNTSNSANWNVWHRNAQSNLCLNSTGAEASTDATYTGAVRTVTDTTFTLYAGGGGISAVNASGNTYVAYLFAHNAGGFGPTGTDSVISCGMFTTDYSYGAATVNLGWEPQWVMTKAIDSSGAGESGWIITDNMRGMPVGIGTLNSYNSIGNPNDLYANYNYAEQSSVPQTQRRITSTGFEVKQGSNCRHIYIAIRRGPMKVPTSGTSVFSPLTTSSAYGQVGTTNFTPDTVMGLSRDGGYTYTQTVEDRLRGFVDIGGSGTQKGLFTTNTNAEVNAGAVDKVYNTGWVTYNTAGFGSNASMYSFGRAPGFFDVVCWKFNGSDDYPVITHNLGVIPQLIIMKDRTDSSTDWMVMPNISPYGYLYKLSLNTTSPVSSASTNWWAGFNPTATQFQVDRSFAGGYPSGAIPSSTASMTAYLFATVAGVSKVGSYTGTAALQTVNCGFTTGARFVLIKRTDSSGDWYVWDSARGISSGSDPYLLWNKTDSEVTGTNYVDTTSVGFQVTAAAPAGINESGGTYIFLAIA